MGLEGQQARFLPRLVLLAVILAVGCGDEITMTPVDMCGDAPCPWAAPPGFPRIAVPEDNPMSLAKVELGRFLFYDTRLSGNETQSCGSCHQQALAFSDGLSHAIGSTGEVHPRGAMSLTNVAYNSVFAWANPLLTALERQALLPMFGELPVEMGLAGREHELMDRLRADARYQGMFPDAFPEDSDPFTVDNVIKAISAFERTLISGSSAYDRWLLQGDRSAMSEPARRGMALFFSERLECIHCHGGFNFSDSVNHDGTVFQQIGFHNNGLYNIDGEGTYPPDNPGLYAFTGREQDMGRFRAPTLRNIELTAPYMHDGSLATLEEVIAHYEAGGRTIEEGPYAGAGSESPYKSGFLVGFTLDDQEREDLLAFFRSLTDWDFVTDPSLSDPFAH